MVRSGAKSCAESSSSQKKDKAGPSLSSSDVSHFSIQTDWQWLLISMVWL
jgi:hypothetical protein